ncbi:hypothetical protein N7492_003781 [Penicillium capsulatum]|uniref:Zn(2)-C6 fungal-type domain-containing protein n=1 Tax=Penicillium capsulatum TaxID=69766 RepID=A0A9W9IRS8_9EURO|nr:hypothetical protein N7492_003781 [Penicillium capsulatum]KAJ6121636.1 hypothetical protein N7512_004101 [Penicillium capsulatum]
MPLRRSHTKSRKGCLECKRRHVKCDEGIPKCTLCAKRKLDCSYPASPSDLDSASGSPSAQDGFEADGNQLLPARMLEMRLFHQYLTSTYHTLAHDGLAPYHLSITLPRMATSFPYLLDSILAFSALHLASIEADNHQAWLDAAMRYHSRACSGLFKVLPETTKEHYEPAFAASVFIMLFATGVPVISSDSRPVDPLSKVMEVRALITGCAILYYQLIETGWQGELNGWLRVMDADESLRGGPADRYEVCSTLGPGAMLNLDTCSDGSFDDDVKPLFDLHKGLTQDRKIITSLKEMQPVIESADPEHQTIYQSTWQRLYEVVALWPKVGPDGGVIAWPYFITDAFLALLQEGDWFARVLFLHYGMAMGLLRNRWYVRDLGRRFVLAVLESIDDIPSIWIDTISWIKQGVGVYG